MAAHRTGCAGIVDVRERAEQDGYDLAGGEETDAADQQEAAVRSRDHAANSFTQLVPVARDHGSVKGLVFLRRHRPSITSLGSIIADTAQTDNFFLHLIARGKCK